MSPFAQAVRMKLRFETTSGNLTVEDLWDLPLKKRKPNGICLDDLAINLDNRLKDETRTSFVDESPTNDPTTQLMFDIVKEIIDVKKEEAKVAEQRAETESKRKRIREILAEKKDADLQGKSAEELEALLRSM